MDLTTALFGSLAVIAAWDVLRRFALSARLNRAALERIDKLEEGAERQHQQTQAILSKITTQGAGQAMRLPTRVGR